MKGRLFTMIVPCRVLIIFTVLVLSGCGQPVYYLMPDPVGDDRSGYEFTPDADKNGTNVQRVPVVT